MSEPPKPAQPAVKSTNQRWYPVRTDFDTHAQWDAHIQTLQTLYSLHDKVDAMSKASTTPTESPNTFPNTSSTTKIAGFNVTGAEPQHGQQLTYDATTGEIKWQ